MDIFDKFTYDRLNVVKKVDIPHFDSILKYVKNLPEISFINVNYTKSQEEPSLDALNESRFSNYQEIANAVKNLKFKYELILKPHIITIYGNNIKQQHINHIGSIIRWFEKIVNKQYIITFYLTELKKTLPPSNQPKNLIELYMNSGFTFVAEPSDIHIFRKEESLKVLIHELIHSSKYDFNNKDLIDLPIKIKDENITNEGITEYLAIILYYWYCATLLKRKFHKNLNIEDIYKELLSNDMGWQIYQISKILNYFKIQPTDLLSQNNTFKQRTSVISYFFLKNYLLINKKEPSIDIILSRNINKINTLLADFDDYIKELKTVDVPDNAVCMRMSLYELYY